MWKRSCWSILLGNRTPLMDIVILCSGKWGIGSIWTQWCLLWQLRNQVIHGRNTQDRQRKQDEANLRKLRKIYSQREFLEPSVQELLFDTVQEHKVLPPPPQFNPELDCSPQRHVHPKYEAGFSTSNSRRPEHQKLFSPGDSHCAKPSSTSNCTYGYRSDNTTY